MSTQAGSVFAERFEQLKQRQSEPAKIGLQSIVIRPASPTWEQLERALADVTVIAKPLIWITIKEYFEQGYGAELLTAAEIAKETHTKKNPSHLFISMISKASGNWNRTLEMVKETWQVRRNALEVITRLNLKSDSTKAILKLAWRLKGAIIRFLGIAMEQGTGIKNPAGVFFALTRKPKPQAT